MQTFTIGVGRSWWLRALGRNPLVRASDRIEAVVVGLAVAVAVVAVPFVGAAGTAIYDARIHTYAEQARVRHVVTATAIEDSAATSRPSSVSSSARAQWRAAGSDHVQVINWDAGAKAGDRLDIWVDAQGSEVGPPSSMSRAGSDAVGAAGLSWLGVVVAAGGLVWVARSRLDKSRFAEWEREMGAAADDDGGRMDQKP